MDSVQSSFTNPTTVTTVTSHPYYFIMTDTRGIKLTSAIDIKLLYIIYLVYTKLKLRPKTIR